MIWLHYEMTKDKDENHGLSASPSYPGNATVVFSNVPIENRCLAFLFWFNTNLNLEQLLERQKEKSGGEGVKERESVCVCV